MDILLRREFDGGRVVVGATDRYDGDLHPQRVCESDLSQRQRALAGAPWVMLDQVHGTQRHTADATAVAHWPIAGVGDVIVADSTQTMPLAVWAADCAPVALLGVHGHRVMAHAGWQGLAAGVLDVAVDAAPDIDRAVLGPCIHPCCYEFGPDDLAAVIEGASVPGEVAVGATAWETTALDLPGVVASVLARRGVALDAIGPCTGCDPRFFSHRRRAEPGRHAVISWWEHRS